VRVECVPIPEKQLLVKKGGSERDQQKGGNCPMLFMKGLEGNLGGEERTTLSSNE